VYALYRKHYRGTLGDLHSVPMYTRASTSILTTLVIVIIQEHINIYNQNRRLYQPRTQIYFKHVTHSFFLIKHTNWLKTFNIVGVMHHFVNYVMFYLTKKQLW